MIKYYWDSQAGVLPVFKNKLRVTDKILEVIKKRKCKNILEIGSGLAGDSLLIAQKSKCKITCIDFSPEMIRKVKIVLEEKT